jgi:hypothetical protein
MKKILLFFVIFAVMPRSAFSLNNVPGKKCIIVSNNVNVRDNSSMNSRVMRQVSFPELIEIFEIKGSSSSIRNGILDKWVRISKDKQEWVNYYYVASFPFVISSREEFYYGPDDSSAIIIRDYYHKDGQLFFNVEKNLNSYYHKDTKYDILASDEIQGISVIDNAWTRLYDFCGNFVENIKRVSPHLGQTLKTEIDSETIILDYGIHVGMDWNTVVSIFGTAYDEDAYLSGEQRGKIYSYAAMYVGGGYWLKFYVSRNKVEKIEHQIEK